MGNRKRIPVQPVLTANEYPGTVNRLAELRAWLDVHSASHPDYRVKFLTAGQLEQKIRAYDRSQTKL